MPRNKIQLPEYGHDHRTVSQRAVKILDENVYSDAPAPKITFKPTILFARSILPIDVITQSACGLVVFLLMLSVFFDQALHTFTYSFQLQAVSMALFMHCRSFSVSPLSGTIMSGSVNNA